MTESKCQHCQQDVVYGTTEHGYRGFVHTANGTTECPKVAEQPCARCSVRIPDAGDVFGFRYCENPAPLLPHVGAGIAICETHQHDEHLVIRDHRGATLVETAA